MGKVKTAIYVVVLLLVAIFGLEFMADNEQIVTIKTLFGDFTQATLGKALLGVFIGGCLFGFLIGFLPATACAFQNRRLKKQLSSLTKQPSDSAT